jgi:hypothetical protein
VAIQKPAGATHTEPSAVSCPTDDECLAVGSWLNGSYVRSGLIERWSGNRLQILSATAPKGRPGHLVFLNDVACPAARACVVVGERANDSTNPPSAPTPVSERWNGSGWRPISIAPVRRAMPQLNAVSCTSAAGCMAVGSVGPNDSTRAVAERYNGTRWRVSNLAPAKARRSALNDVSHAGAMCLAVGTQRLTRQGVSASVLAWHTEGWGSAIEMVAGWPTCGATRESRSLSTTRSTTCTTLRSAGSRPAWTRARPPSPTQ